MANVTYTVEYSNGRKVAHIETYEEAIAEVKSRYPDAAIGHDGDLTSGGDRTLCWASEEDSIDDDGARAAAEIRTSPIVRTGRHSHGIDNR